MKNFTGLLMILSGIALTIASAWFGIHGLLIFFPEEKLFQGILFLGVALEIAKIFTAVFLFHYGKDSHLPRSIRAYMGIGVVALILISGVATYVHLSFYVADYIKQESAESSITSKLERELDTVRKERETIDKQIASLPAESVKGRVTLINKFDRRKKQIDAREEAILNKINDVDTKKIEEPGKKSEYAFLDYMSASFGKSRQSIYNFLIMAIVSVLDPLAIFLTVSGTYIIASKKLHRKNDEDEPVVVAAKDINVVDGSNLEEYIEPETHLKDYEIFNWFQHHADEISKITEQIKLECQAKSMLELMELQTVQTNYKMEQFQEALSQLRYDIMGKLNSTTSLINMSSVNNSMVSTSLLSKIDGKIDQLRTKPFLNSRILRARPLNPKKEEVIVALEPEVEEPVVSVSETLDKLENLDQTNMFQASLNRLRKRIAERHYDIEPITLISPEVIPPAIELPVEEPVKSVFEVLETVVEPPRLLDGEVPAEIPSNKTEWEFNDYYAQVALNDINKNN